MNRDNIILATDSYKVSHHLQYPPRTDGVYSFFESRGSRGDQFPETTFFGLQYLLKRYLMQPVIEEDIDEAEHFFGLHFLSAKTVSPALFNRAGWMRIVKEHVGRLPVRICAVPEGTTHPSRTPLMTIENTDPELPWLTNYLETLLVQVWYPTTVCTQSRKMRSVIAAALEETGNPESIDFKLHDFGFRGSTSLESSAIGGCAHLVSFMGTDTVSALVLASDFYNSDMAGFSIPAAEHSTITSWGREREVDAYRNMLEKFPGMVAVVSDSYDIFRACRELWGEQLRDKVFDHEGTLVIRPDSGDPPSVVVKVLEILAGAFGYGFNAKQYKVLNEKVRVIQGDGIDLPMLHRVLDQMKAQGWSADNIAFGSGGGIIQKDIDRDTCKFAFKCCAIHMQGEAEWRGVYKDPVTDHGKQSRGGRLTSPTMRPVFENGELLVDDSLQTIRDRAHEPIGERLLRIAATAQERG